MYWMKLKLKSKNLRRYLLLLMVEKQLFQMLL